MTTRWTIGIDWDRDGSYTDETARVLSAKWTLGCQQAYMDVGNDAQLRLILRNEDKRFTPENSAGSLYGKLAPLRPVKVESHDGSTIRRHFSGWVQSNPSGGQSEWRTHRDDPGGRRHAILEGDRDQDRAAGEPAQRPDHRRPDPGSDLPAGAERFLGAGRPGLQQAIYDTRTNSRIMIEQICYGAFIVSF